MQTRLAPVGTVDTKTRTAELVWSPARACSATTGGTTRPTSRSCRWIPAHVRLGRLQSGAPLLDTHNRYDLSGVLGVVENATVRIGEGPRHGALLRARRGDPIFNDVAAGIIRNVSVGYIVHKYEQSRTPDGVLVMRAVDWEPSEISLVPVGADAGAGVRASSVSSSARSPAKSSAVRRPGGLRHHKKGSQHEDPEELAAEAEAARKQQEEQERAEQARKEARRRSPPRRRRRPSASASS
jgi:hypothetical protein